MTTFNVTGSNLTIHQEIDRNMKFYSNMSLTGCKRETIQKKCPIGVNTTIELKNITMSDNTGI